MVGGGERAIHARGSGVTGRSARGARPRLRDRGRDEAVGPSRPNSPLRRPKMTNPPDASTRPAPPAEADRLYLALARDARYGHYVRIPERICRCLDYFQVAAA